MKDAYIYDNGDEFPINNRLRCGQTAYVAEFGGEVPVEVVATKAVKPASTVLVKQPYFPKAKPRLKKQA
ncbi:MULTISPECIES: hypothetical protein [Pseudomonas]|jgi:hypothetical protein|uniref:Uncharacterized protein n=1 Tax=Pseudomonas gingeri TaxID=117681 RepID=A0A7Y7WAB2_9PSED|nr:MULTISPECIES: hypothetical protein [Pseudomonas]MCU1739695.1 hypothetical protein [Pseudomonas sp. 20S_6.2_Bac1]NWB45737.1 hypothetical protein [Pseudomonas gingeri]